MCAALVAAHTDDLPTGFRLAFAALAIGAAGSLLSSVLIRAATRDRI